MATQPSYLHPPTLSASVAPTAAQTKERVVATINATTSATSAVVVHNMGLTAAELAAGAPIVNIEPRLTTGYEAGFIASAQSANGTTFQALSVTTSALAAVVTLRRPHTIGH